MTNNRQETSCPPDGERSGERNAKAMEAIASPQDYNKVDAPGKQKPKGPAAPDLVRATYSRTNPIERQAGKWQDMAGLVRYRDAAGRIWAYKGKRGRVLAMLATNGNGVTQWDTLPWHTRLGASVHAMREDGLAIETVQEGEYRHARYFLKTPGTLIIQPGNRLAGGDGSATP